MADAPKKKAGKKLGPFGIVGWSGVALGVVGVYYLYRRYEANSAANAANEATTGGTSIPTDTGGSVTTTSPGATVYSSWADWENAALALATGKNGVLNAAEFFSELQDWYNGKCVSAAGYKLISSALTQQGLPPGGAGALTVCAKTKTKTTGTTNHTTPGQSQLGSGYGTRKANPGTTVTSAGGTIFTKLSDIEQKQYKGRLFYEVIPGVFQYYVPGKTVLDKGTPVYAHLPS